MTVTMPSERNFAIFHAVETERLSRRAAAERFGISSSRVQQIADQVRHFIGRHGSRDLQGVAPEHVEVMSLRMCYEKLSRLSTILMNGWNALQGQGSRGAGKGSAVPLPVPTPGSLRMVHLAARLTIEQTRVAARSKKALVELEPESVATPTEPIEYVYNEDEADEVDSVEPTQVSPNGGCTALTPSDEQKFFEQALATPISAATDDACDELFNAMLRRKAAQDDGKTPARRRRR